jgi:hypothetical protein
MRATARFHKPAPAYRPHDHLKPGRPARNDEERALRHAEIAARYANKAKDARRKSCNPFQRIARLRLYDLENLIWGRGVPADGGWDYLTLAAHHIAFASKPAHIVADTVAWAHRCTPSLPTDRVKLLSKRIATNPRRWSADKLAWRLRLTVKERTDLGITTIGAIDMTKAARAALRKQKRNEADRERRAAQSSGKPRGRPSKGKPWEQLGVSKATYYRHRETKMHEPE